MSKMSKSLHDLTNVRKEKASDKGGDSMTIVLGGLFLAMVLQAFFSYMQLKAVYGTLGQMKREHAGSGHLAMGSAKSKIPFCKGVAVIIVVDETGVVVEYREMQGRTVFAKFKRRAELTGLTMETVVSRVAEKMRVQALKKAVQLIDEQRSRQAVTL